MTHSPERTTTGPRLIATVYLGLVALAGVLGALIGLILPAQKGVTTAAIGPFAFPLTPVTMAVYGVVAVGLTLGVLLLAVRFVSDRFDDAGPGTDEDDPTAE